MKTSIYLNGQKCEGSSEETESRQVGSGIKWREGEGKEDHKV
jgi:hypothetical protein